MKASRKPGLIALVLAFVWPLALAHAAIQSVELRCEYGLNPMGVDVPHPRLSWKLVGDGTNQRQMAWQILVATSPNPTFAR